MQKSEIISKIIQFAETVNIGDKHIKGAGVVYDGKHLEEWIAEEGGAE